MDFWGKVLYIKKAKLYIWNYILYEKIIYEPLTPSSWQGVCH